MPKFIPFILILFFLLVAAETFPLIQDSRDELVNLAQPQGYRSKRISSYDRTGGNSDALAIEPGQTAVLAEIPGPGAIHHIWVTISAEPFYGRKLILRMYWDGETSASVEAPIGDFFGVGHGLNRNFSSLPINCSSEGRAKNCYWLMPFQKSALVTVTNEGTRPVAAFYYYIDYRELKEVPASTRYFHAQYHQEMPCEPGRNYLLLEAEGSGHYVGCNMSVLQRAMGWWGEGDDMIYVDGEEQPSLHGTGSEDYFSDAWGMRVDENPYYGCPLQEEDFQAGSKATVYRFHIPDPIPFEKSIRVTIEHGHANDRSDYFSSVAYWYQVEPHKSFPPLPAVEKRLPFALEQPSNFILPNWKKVKGMAGSTFEDKEKGLKFEAPDLLQRFSSYYNPGGARYPSLATENASAGTRAVLSFLVEVGERYNIELYFLRGPAAGTFKAVEIKSATSRATLESEAFDGYSADREIATLSLKDIRLQSGANSLIFEVTGKSSESKGYDLSFVGMSLVPSSRHFVSEWNLIGPFDAPDMDYLPVTYPPETEIALDKTYPGKANVDISWRKIQAEATGYVRLTELIRPSDYAIAYALTYVYSPDARATYALLGSDDGVRLWLNDELVHSNPAYRGAYADQDKVAVKLKKGWNKVLVKVLQGGGGWGFYLRLVDPDLQLRYSTSLEK